MEILGCEEDDMNKKKATNTQNLFNLMKEKKNYLQGCTYPMWNSNQLYIVKV